MKSLILAVGFFLIIGIGKVWAGGEMICYYPKICKEIKGTEYSSGGSGNRVIHYVELDCVTKDGVYVKYIDRFFMGAGLFGFGRLSMPDKIIFKPWDKDELQCKAK